MDKTDKVYTFRIILCGNDKIKQNNTLHISEKFKNKRDCLLIGRRTLNSLKQRTSAQMRLEIDDKQEIKQSDIASAKFLKDQCDRSNKSNSIDLDTAKKVGYHYGKYKININQRG